MRGDGVVPFAVEAVGMEWDGASCYVGDFDPGGIPVGVEAAWMVRPVWVVVAEMSSMMCAGW